MLTLRNKMSHIFFMEKFIKRKMPNIHNFSGLHIRYALIRRRIGHLLTHIETKCNNDTMSIFRRNKIK